MWAVKYEVGFRVLFARNSLIKGLNQHHDNSIYMVSKNQHLDSLNRRNVISHDSNKQFYLLKEVKFTRDKSRRIVDAC